MAGKIIIMRKINAVPHSEGLADALANLAIAAAKLRMQEENEHSFLKKQEGLPHAEPTGKLAQP